MFVLAALGKRNSGARATADPSVPAAKGGPAALGTTILIDDNSG
jgi:hypothetical protein